MLFLNHALEIRNIGTLMMARASSLNVGKVSDFKVGF